MADHYYPSRSESWIQNPDRREHGQRRRKDHVVLGDVFPRHCRYTSAHRGKSSGKKDFAMTGLQKTAAAAILAVIHVTAGPSSVAAQSSPSYGRDAKACRLMPTPELDASYGGKVSDPHGSDGDSSICTVNIGGLAVKLQRRCRVTGVPTSIAQGLVGARMMLGAATGPKPIPETLAKSMFEHEDGEHSTANRCFAHYVVFRFRRLPNLSVAMRIRSRFD
jgi:hypothetical protein